MPLSRRTLLSLSVLPAIPVFTGSAAAPAQGLRFDHGVASGDPLADRVILWTRVSGVDKPVDVAWQIARLEQVQAFLEQRLADVKTALEHLRTQQQQQDQPRPDATDRPTVHL